MWRPGFTFAERHVGLLKGAHRRLCVYSFNHRGTPERPGLVLGLDRGGACKGVAYFVRPENVAATRAYLKEREQISMVYDEVFRSVRLLDGRTIEAMTYIVNRNHRQYAAPMPRDRLLHFVRQGVGLSGPNPDYVRNTHLHLLEIGIVDPTLRWLTDALQRPADSACASAPVSLPDAQVPTGPGR
jgi:cation transport protein ChaC